MTGRAVVVRVLVVDDTATTRALVAAVLGADQGVRVVGEAATGAEAVALTHALRPDVITMDVQMPGMDGFEATRRIMAEAPTPIVIVSAALDVRAVETSMEALRAGALAVLPPPPGVRAARFDDEARRFVATVKAMAAVKVVRRRELAGRVPSPPPPPPSPRAPRAARLVAVAASTGGPAALQRVLAALPGDFAAPVLVVQHIAAGFAAGFAAWLGSVCPQRVGVARDGEVLAAGRVYVAPDDQHLGVGARPAGLVAELSAAPPVEGFRPSGTHLFETAARCAGAGAVAVVLTGMGRDGADGLRAVRAAGGYVVAQDEASSVVFGMPGAAVAAGLADAVLPLGEIARHLRGMV